jgi:hypothetical protein
MIKMSASRKLQGADGVSQQQTNLGMALYYPAITPNPMQQSKGTIGDPLMSVHERHRCLDLSNESWPGARARRAPCCRTTVRAAAPAGARPSARLPPSDATLPQYQNQVRSRDMAAACLVEGLDAISVHASEVAEAPSVASAVATTVVGVDIESGGVGGVRAGGVEGVGDVEAIGNAAIENLAVVAGEGGGLERGQGDDLEKHLQAGGGKGGDIRCAAGCGLRACTFHVSETGHGVTCRQSAVAAPASTGGGAQSDRGRGLPFRSELHEKPRKMIMCWEPTIETTERARVRSNASLQIPQNLLWSKILLAEGNGGQRRQQTNLSGSSIQAHPPWSGLRGHTSLAGITGFQTGSLTPPPSLLLRPQQ